VFRAMSRTFLYTEKLSRSSSLASSCKAMAFRMMTHLPNTTLWWWCRPSSAWCLCRLLRRLP
jgi:hypothetical protein